MAAELPRAEGRDEPAVAGSGHHLPFSPYIVRSLAFEYVCFLPLLLVEEGVRQIFHAQPSSVIISSGRHDARHRARFSMETLVKAVGGSGIR